MAKKSEFLMYKGKPLVRNGKTIYYGYMSDPYVAILQITSTREVKGVEVAEDETNPYDMVIVLYGDEMTVGAFVLNPEV